MGDGTLSEKHRVCDGDKAEKEMAGEPHCGRTPRMRIADNGVLGWGREGQVSVL